MNANHQILCVEMALDFASTTKTKDTTVPVIRVSTGVKRTKRWKLFFAHSPKLKIQTVDFCYLIIWKLFLNWKVSRFSETQ